MKFCSFFFVSRLLILFFREWRQIYTQKHNQKYLSKNISESLTYEREASPSGCAVTLCVAKVFDAFRDDKEEERRNNVVLNFKQFRF